MKFLHTADLHLGKQLCGYALLEDQRHMLSTIIRHAQEQRPDALLIAGDVYDKSAPSTQAVQLLDDFLTQCAQLELPVYMIAGNHDSAERLGFGRRILRQGGLHIAGSFEGSVVKETLFDEHGPVHIFLLPFLRPGMVRPYAKGPIESYDDALREALALADMDAGQRNVLLAHQFVIGGGKAPIVSDSESFNVGGVDSVDGALFAGFDYVALGHIHGPQRMGRETMRYAGSPLKYSFSEARHNKSIVMVTMDAKGDTAIDLLPIAPLRDLREVRGPLAELVRQAQMQPCEDYIRAVLTDEREPRDAFGALQTHYPNLMQMDFAGRASAKAGEVGMPSAKKATPVELFAALYQRQHGAPIGAQDLALLEDVCREEMES